MELLFDPEISRLGIYPKNVETNQKEHKENIMFIAVLLTITKVCKLPKCPSVDEQIKKL